MSTDTQETTERRSEWVRLRVAPSQKERYDRMSEITRKPFSTIARDLLDSEADRVLSTETAA